MRFVRDLILLAALTGVAAACGQTTTTPTPATGGGTSTLAAGPTTPPTSVSQAQPTEEGQTYVIRSNTQAFINADLSIASGNFWEEEYTDAGGAARYGPTAGLWITFRAPGTTEPQNTHVWVHAGQEVPVGGYRIEVLEISGTGPEAWVKLAVRQ